MAALTLEGTHDFADANDAALSVLRLAVPNAPAQPLDLRDDHRLRLRPVGIVRRQSLAACRLGVLHSHRDDGTMCGRPLGFKSFEENSTGGSIAIMCSAC